MKNEPTDTAPASANKDQNRLPATVQNPMKNSLIKLLASLPPGPISDPSAVVTKLTAAWPKISGSSDGGMKADKLDRMESPSWDSPFLTFTIERHGARTFGSTRAELQDWCVDVSTWTAKFGGNRHRRLQPAQPRLDVSGFVKGIGNAILNNRKSSSIKRYPDGRVTVLIRTIIPDDGFKQTIAGRRKRFRKALDSFLSTHGWRPVRPNVYQRSPSQRLGFPRRSNPTRQNDEATVNTI